MLNILSAKSHTNWISYTAGKHTARAIRHKNGEITTEAVMQITPPPYWGDLILNTVGDFLFRLLSVLTIYIIPLLKGYKLNPLIKNHEISSNYYLISLPFLILITIISVVIIVVKDPRYELRKNHGAEHKILAAYKVLQRIPTTTEAKSFTRICNVCGATIYSALITGQLIGFFIFINYGIMIPEKVLFFVPLLLHSIFPFNFLGKLIQFITTKEPDDDNIELAIAALTEIVRTEDPCSIISREEMAENIKKAFGIDIKP